MHRNAALVAATGGTLAPGGTHTGKFPTMAHREPPGRVPRLCPYTRRWPVRILAYCLMPNHVHLVAVPAVPLTTPTGMLIPELLTLLRQGVSLNGPNQRESDTMPEIR